MDNLRLYNNLAAYSADVTRKYPTVSAIDEGRGSIKYIKKIASDTSNLPLMNLARAANWVASDATYMTNEDAEKVTQVDVSMGIPYTGLVATFNISGDYLDVPVELQDGKYVHEGVEWSSTEPGVYLSSSSGNAFAYVKQSPFMANLASYTMSDTTTTVEVSVEGSTQEVTGYVATVASASGDLKFLLNDTSGLDITDYVPGTPLSVENNVYDVITDLPYTVTTKTIEYGGGGDIQTYKQALTNFNEFKYFNSVTSVGASSFYQCANLTSISFPESLTTLGQYSFFECTNLTSVTIPSSVTTIYDGAFVRCTGLTSLSVKSGNSAYDSRNNCNSIIETATNTLILGCRNSTIPNTVTSIGNSAFLKCSGLSSVTIPNSVTAIGDYAFSDCTGLTILSFPDSVTTIGYGAFRTCTGLTSISFSDTAALTISYVAFANCTGLTTLTIPSPVVLIRGEAFKGCTNLTSVTINSNSVMSKNYDVQLGGLENLFTSNVSQYIIGDSVTSIGNNVFINCSNLSSITSLATTAPTIQSSTFRSVKTGGTLYYPSGSDYSAWMQTGDYYLGKYNWTAVAQ